MITSLSYKKQMNFITIKIYKKNNSCQFIIIKFEISYITLKAQLKKNSIVENRVISQYFFILVKK